TAQAEHPQEQPTHTFPLPEKGLLARLVVVPSPIGHPHPVSVGAPGEEGPPLLVNPVAEPRPTRQAVRLKELMPLPPPAGEHNPFPSAATALEGRGEQVFGGGNLAEQVDDRIRLNLHSLHPVKQDALHGCPPINFPRTLPAQGNRTVIPPKTISPKIA